MQIAEIQRYASMYLQECMFLQLWNYTITGICNVVQASRFD